ncbi:DUF4139 domain-containing protein [Planctomycetota bacterium]|nr:DUF4139 domain-containing protein [Planctomycetota bacterium]
MKTKWTNLLMVAALAALIAPALSAKEELTTLPDRDSVQLTIYNSVDLTLVRETRAISFKKGDNRLQFSWAGTLIDATSVEFGAVTNADKLEVLDTSYPPESKDMLIWTISAEEDVSATVAISYFTSGISWSAEYTGIMNSDETAMDLTAYVSVKNNSGEEYEDASVRLVVGSINLVEQIAGLANGQRPRKELERAYESLKRASRSKDNAKKKEIVKQGLSEYYIYSVEGKETIPNRWSKRLESFVQKDVPLRTVYTLDPTKYGNALCKIMTFKNDEKHKLGKEPLPDGTVRLYRKAGDGRLSWMGQVYTKYIPKNEEIKVNSGNDPEVTLKSKRMSLKKTTMAYRWNGRNQYLVGWNTVEVFELELKNFRPREVDFEINVSLNGDFDFESETANKKIDFRTQRFTITFKANEQQKIKYTVTTRHGENAKNK